jgi:hypothetical protein
VRVRLTLFALAAAVLAATPAEARLIVGFQSDERVIDGDREAAFDRMQSVGGQWVRIMISHNRWPEDADRYRAAIEAARARGLHVMVTLLSWQEERRATPQSWAAFTREVVARYGWAVDAWGTANEPNHGYFRFATDTTCRISSTPATAAYGSRVEDGFRILTTYMKVKPGTGTHRKVVRYLRSKKGTFRRVVRRKRVRYVQVRRGPYKRMVRYVPARGRRARYRQKITKTPLARESTVWVSTEAARRVCEQQTWATAYRAVHAASAEVIRALDPTATLVVGDLSPNSLNAAFMDAMIQAAPGPIDADVHGIHPYFRPGTDPIPGAFQMPNLAEIVAQTQAWQRAGRLTGGRTWITELGFVPTDPPETIAESAARAESLGIELLIQYELYGGPPHDDKWDTGLLEPDGTPRPSWFELRDWLAGRD